MYKIVYHLFICLVLLCCNLYADLSAYFSNVNQANCIILKDSVTNRALIIDCGSPASEYVGKNRSTQAMSVMSRWDRGVMKAFANRLLNGVDTWVIITHQHIDHCSLLPSIRSAGANIKKVIVCGKKTDFFDRKQQIQDSITKDLDGGGFPVSDDNFVSDPSTFVLPAEISGIFGPNSVQFLLPRTWLGDSVHDQNIVVKVRYRDRVLLFPGDAHGKLLDQIIEQNPASLNDIDFLVLSHHGSNDSGELAWFMLPVQRVKREISSMLTIVSSDPSGEHSLPWNIIRSLCCSSGVDYCSPHTISVRKYPAGKLIVPRFTEPIFTTCDSEKGYYRLVVSDFGAMTLYDGDEVTPQFYNFRTLKSLRNEIYRLFSAKLTETDYCKWCITELHSKIDKLSVREKAKITMFLTDYPDQKDWNLFVLKHNLLGDEYLVIRNFLITSLYNTSVEKTNLRNALLNCIKHYTKDNGYQEDETFYSFKDNKWLRNLLSNPIDFENFLQFLIKNEVFQI